MGRSLYRNVIISFIIAVMAVLVACGPVTSTTTINSAELAIESARLEEAELYAVYEFVSAEQYLDKAKEEWGYSDYQHAESYAEQALAFARQARERAIANPSRGAGTRPR